MPSRGRSNGEHAVSMFSLSVTSQKLSHITGLLASLLKALPRFSCGFMRTVVISLLSADCVFRRLGYSHFPFTLQ